MNEIHYLLNQFKESFPLRKQKVIEVLQQDGVDPDSITLYLKLKIAKPEPIEQGIPTLEEGYYRQPTPMIKARFDFAGTIVDGRKVAGNQ